MVENVQKTKAKTKEELQREYQQMVKAQKENLKSNLKEINPEVQQLVNQKILKFFGFFRQRMYSQPKEKETIRKVVLIYFLEDQTLKIIEPQVVNSGMMQGQYLTRQRVLVDKERAVFLNHKHLMVGREVEIYSTVFYLYDIDGISRKWYEMQGIEQPESEQPPEDDFQKIQRTKNLKNNNSSL